eukprot:928-Pelagomonas_calceolata.AAC.3
MKAPERLRGVNGWGWKASCKPLPGGAAAEGRDHVQLLVEQQRTDAEREYGLMEEQFVQLDLEHFRKTRWKQRPGSKFWQSLTLGRAQCVVHASPHALLAH